MTRSRTLSRSVLAASLLAAIAAAAPAWAQQEQGRVISSSPIRTPDGVAGYSVTYEYAGRQYSMRTESPPGDYIPVQVTPMGVMAPQPQDQAPIADNSAPAQPWRNVTPEPGVVLSGGAAPAPAAVYAPAPVYVAPAPVYVAPGYGYGYGYGYGGYRYPYAYPPVGVSLNLGYSYYRGGRGWR
jgi:hypothetical protein